MDESQGYDELFDLAIERIDALEEDGLIDPIANLSTETDRAVILISSDDDEEFFP